MNDAPGASERPAAPRRPNLLDTLADETFDRLTRVAAAALRAPIALITLVDGDRHVVRSRFGLPERPAASPETEPHHAVSRHVVASGAPLRIEDARAHPLVRDDPAVLDLGMVACAGVPLRDGAGHVLGAFCAIDTRPRRWTEPEVQILSDLAAAAGREIEWREAREDEGRYRTLARAASDVIVSIDRNSVLLSVNPAVEAIFGYIPDELVGQPLSILIPERFRQAHDAGIARFLATGQRNVSWSGIELPGLTRAGEEIPLEISFGVYHEDGERVFTGIIRDIRERKRVEQAIWRSEQRFHLLVAATAQIVWTTDPDGTLITEQPAWSAFTGQTFDEYQGWGWMDAIHPEDRARTADAWSSATASRSLNEFTHRLRRHDGEYRDFSVRGVPVLEGDGSIREWVGTHTDITKQKRAEEEREFLIEASEVLTSSLNYERTLASVARLAVEQLADWCAIDILDDGQIRRVVTAHRDPAKEALVGRLQQYQLAMDSPGAAPQVIRTGKAVLYPDGSDALLQAVAKDSEHLELLRKLGLRSGIVVPLLNRGSIVGAITLVAVESGRRYGPGELKLAEDLARRAAVAVDNARLFRETEEARDLLESQAAELEIQLERLQLQASQLERNQAELEVANLDLKETEAELRRGILERAWAQEGLRASELSYRSLWDSLTDLVYILDLDGHFLTVNDAVLERYGYPPEEILGSTPALLAAPGRVDLAELAVAIQKAVQGEPQRFEFWARTRGGDVFPKEVVLNRGEYFGASVVIAVGRDISERKQAEVALRESEERFRSVVDSLGEGLLITDLSDRVLYANPRIREIFGYAPEELVGRNAAEVLIPAEEREDFFRRMEGRPHGVADAYEVPQIRKDGSRIWTEVHGSPMRNSAGEIVGTVGAIADITEWKRVEAERAAAEAHYRRLVMRAPHGIFVVDSEGHLTELNPAGAQIISRPAAEVLGRHFGEVVAPEDMDRASAICSQLISGTADHLEVELHTHRPSGERRLLDLILTPIRESGTMTGIHGTARDITEERARQEQMRLLTSALEGLDEGVSVARFDGQLLYANSTHARLFGYDRDGDTLPNRTLFIPDEAEAQRMEEMLRAVAEHGTWAGRVRRRRLDDGRVIPVELIVGRVDREDSESVVFNIARDVTDEIQKEQRLRRMERLASVGTLIGGVAHELNNPLHAIRSFAELLLMEERGADDREALEIIQREADRAAKIVSDLRLIARETQESEGGRSAVDLNDVVRHVVKVRRYSLETGNVELLEELAEDLPPVLATRGEIEQVVLNLVVNAEQAMEGQKGTRRLTLRTRRTSEGAAVHIVDTGPGISPRHMERIFDPFFTTKSPGEGTGLGLSLVHSIVTEHGGEIHVDSEIGKGTGFRIDLPRAAPDQGPTHAEKVSGAPARSLHILVVDDEDAVRRVSVRFLERLGHRVDTAAEGEEALRLLGDREYDVILSDLRMPGLGGEELFQRLRDQGHGMERRLIFVTGDGSSAQAARVLDESNVRVLVKPVHLEDLARAIELATRDRKPGAAGAP